MPKKILIIIVAILLLIAGIASYFIFFSTKKPGTSTGTGISLQDLFPFGDNGKFTNTNNNDGDNTDQLPPDDTTTPIKAPRLRMITQGPIAGAYVFDGVREKKQEGQQQPKVGIDGKPLPVETEPVTIVRYIETSTGHTDETYLDVIELIKLTNTTVPKIAEGYFAGKGGTSAILRYADEKNIIQTFSGAIPEKSLVPDTKLRGIYLPEETTTMAIAPDREKIFTISKSDNGVVGTISLPDGTKKNQILSLDYTEWVAGWPSAKFVAITTKPSAKVPGYLYTIDTASKIMKKVLGGVNGLTTLTSPDMKKVLFSRSVNGGMTSSIYSTDAKSIIPLPGANTLPEKCVWQSATILYCAVPSYLPSVDYPDAWYQGAISFNDQIYKIDLNDYTSIVVGNPSSVNATIDATNLVVDPANTYLVFINKKDGSLWSLDLQPE
ncbi:MAG: hypothetical protein RL641_317 [Candidatus Parcubacteria bacterium]|jgi:hypothetical protein